jgi:DNA-directed RNA polymerase specialized sigma24 family protein
VSKVICIHLEEKLRNKKSQSLRRKHIDEYRHYLSVTPDERESYDAKATELEKKLKDLGLPSWRVELLMDRYVDGLSVNEIAEKRGYLSRTTIYKLLNETTEVAKKLKIRS